MSQKIFQLGSRVLTISFLVVIFTFSGQGVMLGQGSFCYVLENTVFKTCQEACSFTMFRGVIFYEGGGGERGVCGVEQQAI